MTEFSFLGELTFLLRCGFQKRFLKCHYW